ncbi:hypothetical protein OQA88_5265 [Cercophora sp. LCS_1]
MAEDVGVPELAGRKPLHPFFTPGRAALQSTGKLEASNTSGTGLKQKPSTSTSTTDASNDTPDKTSAGRVKRRKTNGDHGEDEETKKRGKKQAKPAIGGGIAGHFKKPEAETVDQAVNAPEGNIVSAAATESSSQNDQAIAPAQAPQPGVSTIPLTTLPDHINNTRSQSESVALPSTARALKPKKLLELNPKTGTIGPPPRKKSANEALPKNPTEARIVTIKYGDNATARTALGSRINAILKDEASNPAAGPSTPPSPPELLPSSPTTPKSKSSPKLKSSPGSSGKRKRAASKSTPQKRPRTTHPFFLGKAKKTEAVAAPEESANVVTTISPVKKRAKEYSSTPCSPKKPRVDTSGAKMPQFGVKNMGLKFPGSKIPAWPWKGMLHVRGDDQENAHAEDIVLPLPSRKSKGNSVKIPASESILDRAAQSLDVPATADAVRDVNTDEFLPAPPELRLPEKHFESGRKLQARVLPELRTFRAPILGKKKTAQQKQQVSSDAKLQPPPQLSRLYDSVFTGLSAFDKSQCETSNWVQKYAPACAVEVLQPGHEQFLLRDWLQALKVQSVDTGNTDAGKSSKGKGKGAGKKKRRKKLDGFIVSSDDEDCELHALSEDEADWAPSGSRGIYRKTVVRKSDLAEGDKVANTLVISGPHGCGKTAAVYAVAKELEIEIFEINPGSRRSGKDVVEKIGDMTRNHLVQQHQSASAAQGDGKQGAAQEDDTIKDVKSGKQATMSSFFKPKSGTTKPKTTTKPVPAEQQKEAKKESPKTQRQSLILIEEGDILYEEDKQFWSSLISLIVQSRRPFIITCNDETLLPLASLKLHGIFRLSSPPKEMAIDRLLLVAANEGHALKRQAVESLYESRNQDLRAATMDLQYWCQIGVGDRRGGFDWFYPRWPKGIDLDEDGQVVRVVSAETYSHGMNWLGRDSVVDPKVSHQVAEEELLVQSWDSWAIDLGHWQDSVDLSSWSQGMQSTASTAKGRIQALEAFGCFSESMSAADVIAYRSFATFKEETFDTTRPDLPAKARDDFVLGLMHLDTHAVLHYDLSSVLVASTIKSLAKSVLRTSGDALNADSAPELEPLDESGAIKRIHTNFTTPPPWAPAINRIDFAFAFDPIAASESTSPGPASYLDPSIFDRNLLPIALDVAPFVRGIVAYDSKLQKQRLKLSSLVSQGGRPGRGKRMRTTRAALSALEGGSRSTTRGERWFKAEINPLLVMKTAGEGWKKLISDDEDADTTASPEGSSPASPASLASPADTTAMAPCADSSPMAPKVATKKKPAARRGRPRKVIKDESADELGDD